MTDWTTWAIVVVSFTCGGLFKGVTGLGLPLIALPMIAPRLGMPAAIAIITLPSILTNLSQVSSLRGEARNLPCLPPFLATGILGVAGGTLLMARSPEAVLSAGLGVILLVYLALRLAHPDLMVSAPLARRIAPGVGLAAGLIQGLTGIVAPIGVTFFNAMRLPRPRYIFATSAMFLLFALVQFTSVSLVGAMTAERILQGVVAALVALAAMPLGARIGRRLSPATFDRLILTVLAILSAQLLLRSLGTILS